MRVQLTKDELWPDIEVLTPGHRWWDDDGDTWELDDNLVLHYQGARAMFFGARSKLIEAIGAADGF